MARDLGNVFRRAVLNFCDFSRYAPNEAAVRKGNIWGLPVNLILFTLVAGVTTIAAYTVYGQVLIHPDQISARFSSWFLAMVAAVTFAVATLGINVVANFVSPAFDFSNVFPRLIDFKKGGYIAALIALVLYPFAPWQGSAASFVGLDRRDDGTDLRHHDGGLLPDPPRARSMWRRCTRRMASTAIEGGWNSAAIIAFIIGALFSSVLPNIGDLLPSWWSIYGWFFGVAIGGGVYYAVGRAMPRPALRRVRWLRQ